MDVMENLEEVLGMTSSYIKSQREEIAALRARLEKAERKVVAVREGRTEAILRGDRLRLELDEAQRVIGSLKHRLSHLEV